MYLPVSPCISPVSPCISPLLGMLVPKLTTAQIKLMIRKAEKDQL